MTDLIERMAQKKAYARQPMRNKRQTSLYRLKLK
jgi:hypothetical protein